MGKDFLTVQQPVAAQFWATVTIQKADLSSEIAQCIKTLVASLVI